MKISLVLTVLGVVLLASNVEAEQEKKWGWISDAWKWTKNVVKQTWDGAKNIVQKVVSWFESTVSKIRRCYKECDACPDGVNAIDICKNDCFEGELLITVARTCDWRDSVTRRGGGDFCACESHVTLL